MLIAALYGAGSGALHAVSGPDHLLSLGPLALSRPKQPWRLGLSWGLGHGAGTLLLGLPVLLLTRLGGLAALALWGDRLAGLALLGTAAWSALSLRARASDRAHEQRSPLLVGFVHGVTGAAGLLLVLPLLVRGSALHVALFLAMFALSGALAMASLTSLIARLGARLAPRQVRRVQLAAIAASALLGLSWLLAG